jgi:hypothetical protein
MSRTTFKITPLPGNLFDFDHIPCPDDIPCPDVGHRYGTQSTSSRYFPQPSNLKNKAQHSDTYLEQVPQDFSQHRQNYKGSEAGRSTQSRNSDTIAASQNTTKQNQQFLFCDQNNFVKFHDHGFYIDGGERHLLKILDESRYSVRANFLQDEWIDRTEISRASLKNIAKNLRKKLRDEFNLSHNHEDDPVPSYGRGADLSYGLNYKALLRVMRSKNNE